MNDFIGVEALRYVVMGAGDRELSLGHEAFLPGGR